MRMHASSIASLLVLLSGAFLVQESSCVVWESKESPSGVRGRGQITPQLFDLDAGKQLQQQLQDISSQVTDKKNFHQDSRLQKRQTDNAIDDISSMAALTNDSHFHAIVHWTGYPREYMFILTRKLNNSISEESWLWRSTDYGQTFSNETYKFPNDSVLQWFYVSPYTQYLVFVDVKNRRLHMSLDVGDTFATYNVPFKPDKFLYQSKLASNSSNTPYNKYILGHDSQDESLWVSTDLGASWTHLSDNVPAGRYYWRRLGADIEGDLSTVYFEKRISENSNKSMLYFTTFPYNNTQLFSPELGQFQSGSFVLAYEYMFVQKPGSVANSNITYSSPLWVSYRRSRMFKQSIFPYLADEMEHLHFSIIDASEVQVFVAVYHNINTTNLYISDETGTSYTLSLEYIVSPSQEVWMNTNPKFDVHVAEGVVGTVFANQNVPGRDFGSTLISHNKGGHWSQLTPPAVDSQGAPLLCAAPDCSLHLRMESDVANGYQSILSQDTAVGLLMAVGNIGRNLSRTTVDSNVYLSRDGGFTWAEVETRRWEFQFVALGSVIVMVKKQALVNTVKWSCDEGKTWRVGRIDDNGRTRIVVIGMKTEIGEKPRFVTIFGLDYFEYVNSNFEWLIFTVNFTSVVPRQCDPEEDYFDWIPTDERPESRCLLGEVVTYERRNSSACCYVDPEYEKPTNRDRCECTDVDFECDFGFQRETLNSPCNPLPGFTYPPLSPSDCPEGGNYTYTSGYRKISGDKCVEDNDGFFLPKEAVCPVVPATELTINYIPQLIIPGLSVTFTLRQDKGFKMSTVYRWDFNDSTPNVEITGFDSAQLQQHTFARPGIYQVRLSTSNLGGTSEKIVVVSVLDTLTEFSVEYPEEIVEDSVPTGVYLEFNVRLSSQYGTQLLGSDTPVLLLWDFGDGVSISRAAHSSVVHAYRGIGRFDITCTVLAAFSTVDKTVSRTVRTYEAARTVNIISSSLIKKERDIFTRVGESSLFSVIPPSQSGAEIPPQTVYSWQIRGPTDSSGLLTNNQTLEYTFPTWGDYQISVTGDYSVGSFIGMITVLAENDIAQVIVATRPTIQLGTLITLQVSVLADSTAAYMGPISISVDSISGTHLAAHSSSLTDDSALELSFTSSKKGVMEVTLKATNGISEFSQGIKIVIVDTGEYGSITVAFNADKLPSNHNDPEWQKRLTSEIAQYIATEYKTDLKLVQTNIEEVNQAGDPAKSRRMVKRSAETYLSVEVNIFPTEYTEQNFNSVQKVANDIVSAVLNKTFVVNVDGVILTAVNAFDRNRPIIIDPPTESKSNPLVDIILGVVFALLIVAFAVVLVVVVYLCHRRYKQLHTKYSHLEESSGGNLTFNEAFGEQEAEMKEKE